MTIAFPRIMPCLGVLLVATMPMGARAQTSAPDPTPSTNAVERRVTLTPRDVIARAQAHSPALRDADEDVRAATWRHRQAEAQGYPVLDVRADAARYDGIENASLGPGLTLPEIDNRYAVSAGITVPLLTGGRVTALRDSATWLQEAARRTHQSTRDEIAWQTTDAYWTWARAFRQADAAQAAVKRMEAHNADLAALRKAGLATENDRLAAAVQLDQTRLKLTETRRQTDQALANLVLLTGPALPLDGEPLLPDADPVATLPDLSTAVDKALTNRADLAAAGDRLQAARRQIVVARAEGRPQVALAARYEEGRPNAVDFPPTDTWQNDAFVGATLRWNLWDGGLSRAKAGEARARATQAALAVEQAADRIEWQVKTARISLASALDRVAVSRHAEESASLNVKTATDLWKNGLARHSDVLDAEARLTESTFETIATLTDVELSKAQLKYATGTIHEP